MNAKELRNHSNNLNKNNKQYYKSRGMEGRPDEWDSAASSHMTSTNTSSGLGWGALFSAAAIGVGAMAYMFTREDTPIVPQAPQQPAQQPSQNQTRGNVGNAYFGRQSPIVPQSPQQPPQQPSQNQTRDNVGNAYFGRQSPIVPQSPQQLPQQSSQNQTRDNVGNTYFGRQ